VGGHPPLDAPGVIGHGTMSLGDAGDAARLAELFRLATCFVMVSVHEPSATAYAEAAAAGLPCIGITRGGSTTIIGPGGMLVDPTDQWALTQAMTPPLRPGRPARVGCRRGEHAERLTWEKVAEGLIRALAMPDAIPPARLLPLKGLSRWPIEPRIRRAALESRPCASIAPATSRDRLRAPRDR
jgi:Glycosyl transferases group 1